MTAQFRKYYRVRNLQGAKKINLQSAICRKCLANLAGKPRYELGASEIWWECFFKQKDAALEKFKGTEQKLGC